MISEITARTRVFALIGEPVSHSSSPTIQNAAMKDLGLDGVYESMVDGKERAHKPSE